MNPNPYQSLAATIEEILRAGADSATVGISTLISQLSDESLASAVQKEFFPRAAFEELYRRYAPWVRARAMKLGVQAADTDELVQTIFTRLWARRLKSYNSDKGRWHSWLCHFMYHCLVDVQRVRRTRIHPLGRKFDRQDDRMTAEDEATVKEWIEQFRFAVRQLPPPDREVFEERLQGLSYQEIASRLGVTVKSARASFQRAIIRLRSSLKEWPTGAVAKLARVEHWIRCTTPAVTSDRTTTFSAKQEAEESIQRLYRRVGLIGDDPSSPPRINWEEVEKLFFGPEACRGS